MPSDWGCAVRASAGLSAAAVLDGSNTASISRRTGKVDFQQGTRQPRAACSPPGGSSARKGNFPSPANRDQGGVSFPAKRAWEMSEVRDGQPGMDRLGKVLFRAQTTLFCDETETLAYVHSAAEFLNFFFPFPSEFLRLPVPVRPACRCDV